VHLPGHVNALGVDAAGTIYAAGVTASGDFPVRHPIQGHYHTGTCGIDDASHACTDAFVVQVSSAGKLLFATYLGGERDDAAEALAVTGRGRIVVTGSATSSDFPVSRAIQPTNRGQQDTTGNSGGRFDGFVTALSLPSEG
jgi:hypothetical protein